MNTLKIKQNDFTEYELTEEEQLTGQILTLPNIQFIQNLRALAATEKLNLIPDPNNYAAHIQKDASLAGQIQILSYILDCHESSHAIMMAAVSSEVEHIKEPVVPSSDPVVKRIFE